MIFAQPKKKQELMIYQWRGSKFPNCLEANRAGATLPPEPVVQLLLVYIMENWPDFGLLKLKKPHADLDFFQGKWCSLNDGGCPPSHMATVSYEGSCLLKFSEWKNVLEISEGLKSYEKKKRWLSISILDKLKGMYDIIAQETF